MHITPAINIELPKKRSPRWTRWTRWTRQARWTRQVRWTRWTRQPLALAAAVTTSYMQ